jgi:16S rRNA (cytosine967-C5)-methyltransferase
MTDQRLEAVRIVARFLKDRAWVAPLISKNAHKFKDARDFKLLTELVYGSIKNLTKIEAIANSFLKKSNLKEFDDFQRAIIIVSIYELLFLKRIPKYATVNTYVELAKISNRSKFPPLLNGILRNISRSEMLPAFPVYQEYSFSERLFKYLSSQLEENFLKKFLEYTLTVHPTYIRIEDFITEPRHAAEFEAEEYGLKGTIFPETFKIIDGESFHNSHITYRVTFQDFSTQIAQHLIPYVPRGTYLDLASAPFMKATFLARKYRDTIIVANDINIKKIRKARKELYDGSTRNILFVNSDGVSSAFREIFDVVILDAPCSGLGTIRRKPELKYYMTPERITELTTLQLELLETAAQCLKPMGYLVYMTCTINPSENEHQILRFLERHGDFIIEKLMQIEGTSLIQKREGVYVDGAENDCDYFFLSLLKRS